MKEFNILKKIVFFSICICCFDHTKNGLYDANADRVRYFQKKSINFKNNRLLECASSNEFISNIEYYNGENYFDDEEIEYYLTNNGSNKRNHQYNNVSHDLKGINGEMTILIDESMDSLACIPKQKYSIRSDELTLQKIPNNSVNKKKSKSALSKNKNHTSLKTSNNFLSIDDNHFEREYNRITSKVRYRKLEDDNIYTKILKRVFKYLGLNPYSIL
ncbi:fam-b protein [Plasmodium yoelii]|uniref:Fam-b protein n=2 Tax=Plasmodium yoelii TaxID=5861 RepID=A0AAF0AZP2_PLAYO|nr:fam-b protein [Plasmodium yoelii]WBY54418.1 fam-b protein [Plasmodium yoelii yoelii]VTZ71437.1 fam-b protein [Plasmodium yoelii]|eukprot:XP_022811216.1 fam-b protein [Plasmodium yoelii]